MSEQSNTESLVRCCQMTTDEYRELPYKDPSTIYFVNSVGDFSVTSFDEEGDIYLGNNLLTRKPPTGLMVTGATVHGLVAFQDDDFCEQIQLTEEELNAAVMDFDLHVTLQNQAGNAVWAEVWIELGHFEEQNGQNVYTPDEVLASGQTYLAASHGSIPSCTVVSLTGSRDNGPLDENELMFVQVRASGTVSINTQTTQNQSARASQMRIRTYKTA